MTANENTELHLSPTDELILEEIDTHGRATVALLAIIVDRNETHVRERVKRLVEHGVLNEVSAALYDRPSHAADYLPEEEVDQE